MNLLFDKEAFNMKAIKLFSVSAIVATLMLGGCGTMSSQQKNTAIGAGVGGVAGSVLTGGSTAGTVGGAVIGGVVGHETSKDKK
ncbi:MAG: glycine zipper 2TM domain-containing protein [Sulfuricaulis sp.]|nr:glycine zipper 2TM domain-containing protein [Sulfuricaulis sp.]